MRRKKMNSDVTRRSGSLAVLAILAGAAMLASFGCSQEDPGASASTTAPPATPVNGSARTLPIPGQAPAPTMGDGGAKAMPIAWAVPDGWTTETPANNVRLAQYRVPGSGGDGECVVFYFGPGQGGEAMANAQRWAGQFSQPDGSSTEDLMKLSTLTTGKVPLYLVEVTGTYDGGMSADGSAAGYALLGGIAEGPDAPWFFKFTGPEATVREQRDVFIALLESVASDG
jgi:hypothetical protein